MCCPFRVDTIKTMDAEPDIDDKEVWDINREKAFLAPERIRLITEYILDALRSRKRIVAIRPTRSVSRKTCQSCFRKWQATNRWEIKQKQRVSGFNSIFAVSGVDAAKLYYAEFQRQMAENPQRRLKIAVIYSYGANEEETDGILDEENPEDTSALDRTPVISWMPPSATTTRCSAPTTPRTGTSSRITIRMFLCG